MEVYIVVGRSSLIPAGYNVIGVCQSESAAEELKKEREQDSGLLNGVKWNAIDIWNCELK